jgi:hypothetical protein
VTHEDLTGYDELVITAHGDVVANAGSPRRSGSRTGYLAAAYPPEDVRAGRNPDAEPNRLRRRAARLGHRGDGVYHAREHELRRTGVERESDRDRVADPDVAGGRPRTSPARARSRSTTYDDFFSPERVDGLRGSEG